MKNAFFSSKILESRSGKKNKHKLPNPTASDFTLESTFTQSPDSISTILESKKQDSSKFSSQADSLSSRDFRKEVVAIHKIKMDSNANAMDSMDCHADKSARNDRKPQNLNDSAKDSRIFNKNAQSVSDSQAEAKLDSSKSPSDSKILDEKCGLQRKARNDGKNATTLKTPAKDSRICDEKSGLCKRVQGRILGVCNRSAREAIADLSRKAESSSQKPTPEPSKAKTPPVLVSLTSFPARLPYLHHTLYSLFTQDYKDFHIALFLSSSEIAPSKLPLILKIFKKLGLLSIHFVEENLRAYKKLFYALQAYPEHIIITIDDDQIYAPNTISLLLESYKKFPRAIHTHLAYDGAYMADILELDSAAYCAIIKESSPHLALASVGVSGVLYPPRAFSQEFFNTQAIVSLAPYNDDLWFYVMSVLSDMPKVLVQGALEHPKESSIAQDESPNLWEINCEQHRNYDQLRALLRAYPQARAKILESLESSRAQSPA
ncbi:hypothetical protein [Helicobacter canis]|uniref:Glycosyltransferase 2-like domain-containing protein n=1 Tax=Helicobacter canis NCTC 12740 TaxID=1357399 RepID=V8CKQ5_9HELI|nr:hypothetical protein [Helicobacter canis]ETD27605.1 hypothetical protein HMPREF2087_00523 [Helicobacter canis NCTC 12740]